MAEWWSYRCVEFPSCEAIEQHLISSFVVAIVIQQFRDLLHIDSIVEWSSIAYLTFISRHLHIHIVLHVHTTTSHVHNVHA